MNLKCWKEYNLIKNVEKYIYKNLNNHSCNEPTFTSSHQITIVGLLLVAQNLIILDNLYI